MTTDSALLSLVEEAKIARQKAYTPYSNFQVGAALLTSSGEIIHGCNVENASYGLCLCAERTALCSAVSRGYRSFVAMAVVADTPESCKPCGSCRQFLAELCPQDFPVMLSNLQGKTEQWTVAELLPGSFTGKDLVK
ncbi:hypothetical protein RCL1_007974 [Eukaryota sp. TZLM3-RCL]